MKKTLSLLSLATLLVSFSAMAADVHVINNVHGAQSFVVKTTNPDGSAKDSQCIRQGSMGYFQNYTTGGEYKIKVTLFSGMCSGGIVNQFESGFKVQNDSNVSVEVSDYQINIY